MKIALLIGAYKNAGDFLIVQRSRELLKSVYPNAEYIEFERRLPLDDKIAELNTCDAIVLTGGPAYLPDFYPASLPFVKSLDSVKPPIYTLGLGWYGACNTDSIIYRYKFTEQNMKFFSRVQNDSGVLTCRDYPTTRALKNMGFKPLMTGCPAWYCLDCVDRLALREGIRTEPKKICISDPANPQNIRLAIQLLGIIRNRYKQADISLVFHRGIKTDAETPKNVARANIMLQNEAESLGIKVVDISYAADGFSIYDDCDLHIGFRVHAHIYNLSKRNVTLLIEEDGRGAGVNQTLMLPGVPTRSLDFFANLGKKDIVNKGIRFIKRKINPNYMDNQYFEKNVIDALDYIKSSDYKPLLAAFYSMNMYYYTMVDYVRTIGKSGN